MSISIKLTQSNIKITKQMYKALANDLNKSIQKNYKKTERRIHELIPSWIKEQPEVASILQEGVLNSLNAQLGFFSGTAAQCVDAISLAVADSIIVQINPITSNLKGQISFNLQPQNFFNVLNIPEANIQALSGPLPWLSWLLTEGTNTIVFGYDYEPDNSGRSGGGTMTAGKAWRIPPQFAGNITNNFVTRALQNRNKELKSILEETLYG